MRTWLVALSLVLAATTVNGATVVLGLGETLIAGEAEAFVESALAEAGIALVDERGLLQVEEMLGDRTAPLSTAVLEALRPHANTMVLIRAEYLGERPLYYLRQRDAAYQSRLFVTVIDLSSNQPGESVVNKKVEYTQISATDVAERTLRPKMRKLIEALGG
jgi:hypothetical protein